MASKGSEASLRLTGPASDSDVIKATMNTNPKTPCRVDRCQTTLNGVMQAQHRVLSVERDAGLISSHERCPLCLRTLSERHIALIRLPGKPEPKSAAIINSRLFFEYFCQVFTSGFTSIDVL
ncbi:hypothetical protein CAPTEDRAFT_215720 [Capitella teleta]|uniref:Uncharacterized protein n=1 Tax=Capitella teleta TaxID=283909 RepID=R7TNN7_CAPTE|nr:hypothetical protein CAPTEDRAFT_215720 [Capitella teleta]|eukprot:ELT92680.1 hypothetical protein CAPTEDRAFT_215720 [Capitella teleta]